MRTSAPFRAASMDQPRRNAPAPRWSHLLLGSGLGLMLVGAAATATLAAESVYPFEGTWILLQHPCVGGSTHLRTYTAKDVTSARGRCAIRRIAQGSGAFELQEECRHDGRSSTETETIRMSSPDVMQLKRQVVRLKIPRQIHYARCTIPATGAAAPATPHQPGRTVTPASPDPTRKTP